MWLPIGLCASPRLSDGTVIGNAGAGLFFVFPGNTGGMAAKTPAIGFRHGLGAAALTGGGWMRGKQGYLAGRVMHEYALVYLVEGGGWYDDDAGDQRVATGDVIVVFPGQRHGYGRRVGDPHWSEGFVVFHGAVFEQLERDGLIDRRRPLLSPGLDPGLVAAFAVLIDEARSAHPVDARLSVARLHLLLAEIVGRDARRGGDDAFASAARARLEERIDQPLDLVAVARGFSLGSEAFRKRFARTVGAPPARYRQLRRVDRAKDLLASGDLPLAEIAARLGWCDQYFFSRQFKQVTGRTPAAFRRAYRG